MHAMQRYLSLRCVTERYPMRPAEGQIGVGRMTVAEIDPAVLDPPSF